MNGEPTDVHDVPGHDRATGIDDPVPDNEYGDQGHRPEDEIDPAEANRQFRITGHGVATILRANSAMHAVRLIVGEDYAEKKGNVYTVQNLDMGDYPTHEIRVEEDCVLPVERPEEYTEDDEYQVDEHDCFGFGRDYGTYLADDAEHAARRAQFGHPNEDLSEVTVTHMESGLSENINLEPTGQDPGGTTDTGVSEATDEEVEQTYEGTQEPDVHEFLAQHSDMWTQYPVVDIDSTVRVVDETGAAFTDDEELATYIRRLKEYPVTRVATANVTLTTEIEMLTPDADETEVAEEIIGDELGNTNLRVEQCQIVSVMGNVHPESSSDTAGSTEDPEPEAETPEHEVLN